MSITVQCAQIRTWATAHFLSARTRLQLLRRHHDQYTWIDAEYANTQVSLSWLSTQNSSKEAQLLIEYLHLLAPYFQQRSLQAELLQWCEAGIRAANALQQSPGWLLLLMGQAQYARGHWHEARTSYQAAINTSEKEDVQTYGQAMLALGRLEFNQGNYTEAFATFERAKVHFSAETDQEQLLIILGETAAYYLNRKEFEKALSLYLEVDRRQKQSGATESSDHTLLMLGVVYRRKKDYGRARDYLQQLLERGERQQNHAAMATAAHHLGWTYLSQKRGAQARMCCGKAIRLYEEIGDERGLADAYEQLGCIALADGQGQEALRHLQSALERKRQRHSQQGEASVLRHLAIAYLTMGDLKAGFSNLWQSLTLYRKLGVLTKQRIIHVTLECLTWMMGKRQWIK